jgi:hypothetical protein
MLSVLFAFDCYSECRYSECRCAGCRGAHIYASLYSWCRVARFCLKEIIFENTKIG